MPLTKHSGRGDQARCAAWLLFVALLACANPSGASHTCEGCNCPNLGEMNQLRLKYLKLGTEFTELRTEVQQLRTEIAQTLKEVEVKVRLDMV